MKTHATIALAAMAAALSACAAGGPLTQREISPLYQVGDLNNAAARGNVPVVVFDGAGGSQSLQTAALAGLRDGASQTSFALAPQSPNAGYKVVMLFNGPATSGDALCRATAAPARAGNAMPLTAAFCADNRMLTEVEAYGGRIADDASVRQLVRQVASELFPSRDAGTHDVKAE